MVLSDFSLHCSDIYKGKKIVVLYHQGCMDGFASAFIFWYYWGQFQESPIEFISVNPGMASDNFHLIQEYDPDVVLSFDISFREKDVQELVRICTGKTLKIYDHHKTSLPLLPTYQEFVTLDMDICGCMQVFKHLFIEDDVNAEESDRDMTIDDLFKYIQVRDIWLFDTERDMPSSRQMTLGLHTLLPTSGGEKMEESLNQWMKFIEDPISMHRALKLGIILWERKQSRIRYLSSMGDILPIAVGGQEKQVTFINTTEEISDLGEYVTNCQKEDGSYPSDFCVIYRYSGSEKAYFVSIRSRQGSDNDCTVLARMISESSGGHFHAAGCTIPSDCHVTIYTYVLGRQINM